MPLAIAIVVGMALGLVAGAAVTLTKHKDGRKDEE